MSQMFAVTRLWSFAWPLRAASQVNH